MSFSFNSQIEKEPHKTRYSLQITTDNKEQFEFMEKIARECLDGKHKVKKPDKSVTMQFKPPRPYMGV